MSFILLLWPCYTAVKKPHWGNVSILSVFGVCSTYISLICVFPILSLIFTPVLELLLCHIRDNPNIKDIYSGSEHYKVTVYDDDLLFFLISLKITIPNRNSYDVQYEDSNYIIHVHKSEALNMNLPPYDEFSITFPFHGLIIKSILSLSWRYLGKTFFLGWQQPTLLYLLQTLPVAILCSLLKLKRGNFLTFFGAMKLNEYCQKWVGVSDSQTQESNTIMLYKWWEFWIESTTYRRKAWWGWSRICSKSCKKLGNITQGNSKKQRDPEI